METTTSILFVEDEEQILLSYSYILEKSGHKVTTANSGERALEILMKGTFDLILLDVNLPGINGFTLADKIRGMPELNLTPIIFLTSRDLEEDIVYALTSFGDDYIVKPAKPAILLARISALLRYDRTERIGSGSEIVLSEQEAIIDGVSIELTKTERAILAVLIKNKEKTLSREDIISLILGDDFAITPRSIDFQICGLRKKLGSAGNRIHTVRGVGYRLRNVE